jgi:ApaG protein
MTDALEPDGVMQAENLRYGRLGSLRYELCAATSKLFLSFRRPQPVPYRSPVKDRTPFVELPGLRVTVDRIVHVTEAQTPPDRPHCFAYFITIHNDSDVPVTIKGRKWVVKNARGEITAVEGDGVVGQFPRIEPGESFSYNSFHLNDTESAVAEGSYIGTTDDGIRVLTRIPKFEMHVET